MKRLMGLFVAVMVTGSVWAAEGWNTNYEKALEQAKAEGKHVLVDFSGSDWCGWCIRLDKEVFSQPEFKEYAQDNLVLVLVDFPQKKTLPPELKAQNDALLKKFGVRGFPTVFVVSPEGDVVAKTGYQAGGAEAYVKHLKGLIRNAGK
jgi:protein disulfide-isomerase